jgi:putative addiction module component (TIGR02574 family)
MNDKSQPLPADERLTLTPDQQAELDRRLDAYAADRNPGRLATDAIADLRRRLLSA